MPRKQKETEDESQEQENSQSTSGEQPTSQEEDQQETTTNENPDGQASGEQTIEVQAAEGAKDFTSPLLVGKSPEEIDELFNQLDSTVRSQNQELNKYHEQLQAKNQESAPAVTEDPDDEYEDSFITPHIKKLENRLSKKLDSMISPLQKELAGGKAQSAREKLRSELKHFSTLEPHIDQLLRAQNQNPATAQEDLIRTLYFTALGYANSQGINLDSVEETVTPPNNQPQNQNQPKTKDIPQHRPSSTPMPKNSEGKKKHRELTEDERKLAKYYNMTPEEYLDLQDAHDDEVVKPGFSKENW